MSHKLYLETMKTSAACLLCTIQPVATSAVRWVAAGSWRDPSLDEQVLRAVENLQISGDHLGFVFMNGASYMQTMLDSYGTGKTSQMRDVSDMAQRRCSKSCRMAT
ncbi:hypothetical protein PG993_008889 [Apiospora rasikravindrae]|uniref:Uncharacterized protein n=1 Tax=Apiospora rasikravindrae TaxID=990691 RepID=A0ABR1SRC9_9PEZI